MSAAGRTAIGNPRPVYIGQSAGSCTTCNSIITVIFEPVPSEPEVATVIGTIPPIGFRFFHKHYRGEIHFRDLLEAQTAFSSYLVPGGKNLTVPYVVVSNRDTQGHVWTWTFTGFVPVDNPMRIEEDKEFIWVVPFFATNVTVAVS
jgi:hypothetical protein